MHGNVDKRQCYLNFVVEPYLLLVDMAQCTVCSGDYIVDKCILKTVSTYLQDNPILCTGCNLRTVHECMYVWNTETVIAKSVENHINHP